MTKDNPLKLSLEFGDDKEELTRKKSRDEIRERKKNPKYDPRNKLNDLNGAEWQYSTKTVINKSIKFAA